MTSTQLRASALDVEHLSLSLQTDSGVSRVVDDVAFQIPAGRSLGLVGESGCGKSLTALSILGLLPPRVSIAGGSVRVDGDELVGKSEKELQRVRGRRVGMIFQDPMSSLNPSLTIGDQLIETIREHTELSRAEARDRSIELLTEVGIIDGAKRMSDYPHQFSGGMRQRVMIAIALSCDPDLLIADEPTTALDLTVQASILRVLERLRGERDLAMLLISHDLAMVAQVVDEIVVMYAGQVVEKAPAREIFTSPEHPYTEALVRLIPDLSDSGLRSGRFGTLEGQPPRPDQLAPGCRFAPRCPVAKSLGVCDPRDLHLLEIEPGHWVRSDHPRSLRKGELRVSHG